MKIFVSYRQLDRPEIVNLIAERLRRQLGPGNLFKDVDSIFEGEDYHRKIQSALAAADILLVVIGPGWLSASEPTGERRLDKPDDWVRSEIRAALGRHDVRVLPLLVDGATMPEEDDLPLGLKALARRHASTLRPGPEFQADLEALAGRLALGTHGEGEHTDQVPEDSGEKKKDLQKPRNGGDVLTDLSSIFDFENWTNLSIRLRIFLISFVTAMAGALLVVLLSRLILWFFASPETRLRLVAFGFFLISLTVAVWTLAAEQFKLMEGPESGEQPTVEQSPVRLLIAIVWPLLAVAVTSVWLFSAAGPNDLSLRLPAGLSPRVAQATSHNLAWTASAAAWLNPDSWPPRVRITIASASLHLMIFVASILVAAMFGRRQPRRVIGRMGFSFFAMGAVGGVLFQAILEVFVWVRHYRLEAYSLATFGPPLLMLVFVLSGYSQITIAGNAPRRHERLAALLLLHALVWLSVFVSTIYLPWAIERSRYSTTLTTIGVLLWLGSTIFALLGRTLLVGGSTRTRGASRVAVMRVIAALCVTIMTIGLLAVTSAIATILPGVTDASREGYAPFPIRATPSSFKTVLTWVIILAASMMIPIWIAWTNTLDSPKTGDKLAQ